MDKEEFIEEHKKAFILMIIMIVLSIIFVIIGHIITSTSKEKELKNDLTAMGMIYYEQIKYPELEENNEIYSLKEYEDDGLKITLATIINKFYKKDPLDFVNPKTKQKCDYLNSYVLIYPYDSYKLSDYNIKTVLECGF